MSINKENHKEMHNETEIELKTSNANSFEVSKIFKEEYLNIKENPKLLDQSILTTDILFQIVSDLKTNMFHTTEDNLYSPNAKETNQLKMDLWNNEIINSNENVLVKTYRTSDFLKNRDKKKMEVSLEFLKQYKNSIYSFKNAKGDTITTSGGLIEKWHWNKNKGTFTISISMYWANKIVSLISNSWGNMKFDVFKGIKDPKQRFFILWLMDVKKYVGTSKLYESLLHDYKLKYGSSYELMRGFLSPIKTKLDNKDLNSSWFSFNYYIDENNPNSIRIVPYDVKPEDEKKHLSENDNHLKKIHLKNRQNYKVKYFKRRYNLKDNDLEEIKKLIYLDLDLFIKNHKKFKAYAKNNNKYAKDFQGQEFVNAIKHIYKNG